MVKIAHFHHFIFDFILWCMAHIQYSSAQQMVRNEWTDSHYSFQHSHGTPKALYTKNKQHHDKKQAQNKTHIINQPLSHEEAPATGSPITHHSLLHICISLKHSVSVCVRLFRSCVHLLKKKCSVLMVQKKEANWWEEYIEAAWMNKRCSSDKREGQK